MMPNNPRAGGISRRIEAKSANELREDQRSGRPSDMGLIVRNCWTWSVPAKKCRGPD
jgi:Ribonuclease G/E